ncbi:glycosyltransferase [Candidatus Berkelbacteria bacterium]|nr:glycosyltransferase [Candidatus Berkelbacteria bacterium]
MKIGIFGSATLNAPYTPGKINASLKLCYELAEWLQSNGHDVRFLGITDREPEFHVETFGTLPGVSADATNEEKLQIDSIIFERALAYVEREKLDVVLGWDPRVVLPAIAQYPGKRSVPLVMSLHDRTSVQQARQLCEAHGREEVYFVTNSKDMQAYCRSLGDELEPLFVATNGVNVHEITFVKQPKEYIAWVGRIVPSKGLHHALDAVSTVGMQLKVAGPSSPNHEAYFAREIEPRLKALPNVEYLGRVTQEDAITLMANAQALLFPSDGLEPFGMVVVEAMAAGTPVIGPRMGAFLETIVHGESGYLYNDVSEIPQLLSHVAKISRTFCRAYVEEHFSTATMARKYELCFREIATGKV